jgi:hypothetical protein
LFMTLLLTGHGKLQKVTMALNLMIVELVGLVVKEHLTLQEEL